jgi:ubiquinone/menaquinone biosynthesis C-methylase UbiE
VSNSNQAEDLQNMYAKRLGADALYRKNLYTILCKQFFQKFINPSSTVLEIAAGYCEFINEIKANQKIAIDLNPDILNYAHKDVKVIQGYSTEMTSIESNSIDHVYVSNFFEHISHDAIKATIKEVIRVLIPGGTFLILQPNYRYCIKDYYMFFDHITPIDDRGLCEVLELSGFEISTCLPKFLPYTTKSKIPKALWLVKIYLKFPILFNVFGQQAFIEATKPRA